MTSPFRPRYKGIHLDGFRNFYQVHRAAFRQVDIMCRDGRRLLCLETREGKLVYMDQRVLAPPQEGSGRGGYVRVASDQERDRGGDLLLQSSMVLLRLLEPEASQARHKRPAPGGLLCARHRVASSASRVRAAGEIRNAVVDAGVRRTEATRRSLLLLLDDAGDCPQHRAHLQGLYSQILEACNQFLEDQGCRTESQEQALRCLYYAALVDYRMGISWPGGANGQPVFDCLHIDGQQLLDWLSSEGDSQSRLTAWLLAARIHVRRHRRRQGPQPACPSRPGEQGKRMRQELATIMCYCRRYGITAAHMAYWYQQAAEPGRDEADWAARFEHLIFGSNRLMPFTTRPPANDEERALKLQQDQEHTQWVSQTLVRRSAAWKGSDVYRPRHARLLSTPARSVAISYLPELLRDRARLSGCSTFWDDVSHFGQWLAVSADRAASGGHTRAAAATLAEPRCRVVYGTQPELPRQAGNNERHHSPVPG
ncbi:MAG: hypothetical protein OXC07_01215 [Kistimonas sp.]|nr:hypothetical protein [Kistimonas sp.]